MIMTVSSAKCAQRRPFLETLRLLATNLPFLIIFLFLGGAMGYISTLQTKLEQVLCSRGYSDSLAGLAAALIIISGFLASFPLGYAALRSGKLVLVSKAACVPAVAVLAASVWVFGQAGRGELVVAACVVLGVCSLGIYPVMLELSVEATWPLDESVVTGLCYLSSAIQVTLVKHSARKMRKYAKGDNMFDVFQGSILMFTENLFNNPLESKEELEIQTCTERHHGYEVSVDKLKND